MFVVGFVLEGVLDDGRVTLAVLVPERERLADSVSVKLSGFVIVWVTVFDSVGVFVAHLVLVKLRDAKRVGLAVLVIEDEELAESNAVKLSALVAD